MDEVPPYKQPIMRQVRRRIDRPASGQTGPPQDKEAHLELDKPASG